MHLPTRERREAYAYAQPEFLGNHTAVILVEQAEYVTREVRTAFDDDLADAGRIIFITNELWLLQARKEGDHYVEYKTRLA